MAEPALHARIGVLEAALAVEQAKVKPLDLEFKTQHGPASCSQLGQYCTLLGGGARTSLQCSCTGTFRGQLLCFGFCYDLVL